jgi:hypothetical protein
VLNDLPVNDLAMSIQETQGSSFIGAHETGVAGHIGTENGRKATLDQWRLVHGSRPWWSHHTGPVIDVTRHRS